MMIYSEMMMKLQQSQPQNQLLLRKKKRKLSQNQLLPLMSRFTNKNLDLVLKRYFT